MKRWKGFRRSSGCRSASLRGNEGAKPGGWYTSSLRKQRRMRCLLCAGLKKDHSSSTRLASSPLLGLEGTTKVFFRYRRKTRGERFKPEPQKHGSVYASSGHISNCWSITSRSLGKMSESRALMGSAHPSDMMPNVATAALRTCGSGLDKKELHSSMRGPNVYLVGRLRASESRHA